MAKTYRHVAGMACAGALMVALSACSEGLPEVELNSPVLEAVGQKFVGSKRPEPELPERAPLVMPPNNASLPEPGSNTAAAGQWPADPDEQKKLAKAKAKSEEERFCQEGNWNKKSANIEDYNKNANAAERCRPSWFRDLMASKDENEKK